MSKQLMCDKCAKIVPVPNDATYTQFPVGWLTIVTRDPVKADSDRDFCSAKCAIDALIESKP